MHINEVAHILYKASPLSIWIKQLPPYTIACKTQIALIFRQLAWGSNQKNVWFVSSTRDRNKGLQFAKCKLFSTFSETKFSSILQNRESKNKFVVWKILSLSLIAIFKTCVFLWSWKRWQIHGCVKNQIIKKGMLKKAFSYSYQKQTWLL